MPTVLHTPDEQTMEQVVAHRRASGLDRFDEVWNGEYVLMPDPSFAHQRLVGQLVAIFLLFLDETRGEFAVPGGNLALSDKNWTDNYRCPDVTVLKGLDRPIDELVYRTDGCALAVEIVSPGDRTRQKRDFYAAAGVEEYLVIERTPYRVERFLLHDNELQRSDVLAASGDSFELAALPLRWSLAPSAKVDGTLALTLASLDPAAEKTWSL